VFIIRILCLQHVHFEGPEAIKIWAEEKGHSLETILLHNEVQLPSIESFDLLVVLGGPMGVYDREQYPWIEMEQAYIKSAIDQEKFVLGICLGSQMIAEILGANVYQHDVKEIGWFPLELNLELQSHTIGKGLPNNFTPFHWHGDTFTLPENAIRFGSTEGCINQGFVYKNRVVGLQFHLETTQNGVMNMIKHGNHELVPGKYIQTEEQILAHTEQYRETSNQLMFTLLNNMDREFQHASK
jgi:GMP synthase-like glutamine amidotransferase